MIFMEYYHHGSLAQYLANYGTFCSLSMKLYYFNQIALGLKFLINNNIVHNDIKPQNIMVWHYSS
jgi:serine/threonine protein kinase